MSKESFIPVPCSFPGCPNNNFYGNRFCHAHKNQKLRHNGQMFPLHTRNMRKSRPGRTYPKGEGDECPFSHAELKSRWEYDPILGTFLNLRTGKTHQPGERYSKLYITGWRGHAYAAHRIAWYYMTGEWPSEMIDHINGHKADNRWCNLRLASDLGNIRNRKGWNVSGVKGVTPMRDYLTKEYNGKYRGQIWSGGLGRNISAVFNNIEEAAKWYEKMATEMHGEFHNTKHRDD